MVCLVQEKPLLEKLSKKLSAEWLNADQVRENITIGFTMMESLDRLKNRNFVKVKINL